VGDKAISIEKRNPEIELESDEIFGIITPTYWWELPPIVREWLKRLEVTGCGYSFLVATYGTTPGCCGEDARRILKKRGVKLSASFSVKMPDTWTPIFDLSDPDEVAKINEDAERYIDSVIEQIREKWNGNHTEKRAPYVLRLFSDPLLNMERKTRNFYVEDSCIGCGLCERKCPMQAIKLQDKKSVWVKDQCMWRLWCCCKDRSPREALF